MGGDGHPYAPADLHLPGFVPLQLSQGQILAPYLGTSVFVVLAVWLVSGNATTATSCTLLAPTSAALPKTHQSNHPAFSCSFVPSDSVSLQLQAGPSNPLAR